MTKKILVAYASKCGSTGEVAEAMRKALCETGASVDVRLAKAVRDVSGYQGVIVGSAIRLGQWLPEALQFIKRHQAALSRVPVAYFSVGSFLRDGTAKSRQDAAASQNAARAGFECQSSPVRLSVSTYAPPRPTSNRQRLVSNFTGCAILAARAFRRAEI